VIRFGFHDRHWVFNKNNSYRVHDVRPKMFDEVHFLIADLAEEMFYRGIVPHPCLPKARRQEIGSAFPCLPAGRFATFFCRGKRK
jgi:hypothetical protein